MTAQELIDKYNLEMEITEVKERLDGNDEWMEGSRHFKVVVQRIIINRDGVEVRAPQLRYSTFYSEGPGIKTDPTSVEVLSALISDAQAFCFTTDLAEFLAEYYGGTTDAQVIRRGVKSYKGCEQTFNFLLVAFGMTRSDLETVLSEFDPE